MNRINLLLVCFALVGAAPCSAQGQAPGRTAPLRPGDALAVEVWLHPELSGTFEIDELGLIQQPLYHSLAVGGKSLAEIETTFAQFLLAFDKEPRFVVRALMKISVEGQVARPNIYRVPAPTTVPEALALAGGTVGRPDLERVVLQRGNEKQTFDVRSVDIRDAAMVVQSGDRIIVHSRHSILRDFILPIMSLSSGTYSILRVVKILKN
jgi:protein involved in polysaccharide export with SLBB domain